MANRAQRRALKFAARLQSLPQAQTQQPSTNTAVAAVVESETVAVATAAVASAAAAGAAAAPSVLITEDEETRTIKVSAAQLAANRANAQLSRGPVSEAGKSKSSMNAVKTGLTGRTVLLPSDDAAAYESLIARHFKNSSPETEEERILVQQIADCEWRLLKIPGLEAGVWAHGYYHLANLFPDITDAKTRQHMIHIEILKQYRKELSNLALQENRLTRQKHKLREELERIQSQRRQIEQFNLNNALKLNEQAKKEGKPFDPAEFGFEFSKSEFEHYLNVADRQFRATQSRPPFRKVLEAYRAA